MAETMIDDEAPVGSDRLLDLHDALLLDLDGVVYAGPVALPGVADRLEQARSNGLRSVFVTNNAARTPEDVAAQLRRLDIPAKASDVSTSAQAAVAMVAGRVAAGAPVLIVGGAGLVEAATEAGLRPVSSADDEPAAVVQGFHPDLGWRALAEGAYAVARGVPWVASNLDMTLPTERGLAPGNGAMVAAVRTATGREPEVAGKPQPALFQQAALRVEAERPLVVGDRLDTDIAGAVAAEFASLLVLTGVTDVHGLAAAPIAHRPSHVGWDLGALVASPGVPVGAGGIANAGGWRAEVVQEAGGGRLRLAGDGDPHGGLATAMGALWSAYDEGWLTLGSVDVSAVEGLAP